MSVEEENKAIVRRIIEEAWNGGNLSVIDDVVVPSYVGHDPSVPMPIQGPEGFKMWVGVARTAVPDFRIHIDDLIAEGDSVSGRITMRGTHRGDLAGIPATGKEVSFSGIFIRRLEDGKFVEGWDQADTMSLMQQLGVMPAPGEAAP